MEPNFSPVRRMLIERRTSVMMRGEYDAKSVAMSDRYENRICPKEDLTVVATDHWGTNYKEIEGIDPKLAGTVLRTGVHASPQIIAIPKPGSKPYLLSHCIREFNLPNHNIIV